ncbi:MAG: adenylate/guanylate cyclase domain-containing protein [Acidobacteriaceae bacterium]|nr:adenylate/guanylate cyclase domain-containing protein [Acidobacteriaceae bacterium]
MRFHHLAAIQQMALDHGPDGASELDWRWGAVLTIDVVEFSRLMHADARQAYRLYKRHRDELVDPKLREYRARFVKSTGDGIMAEFPAAVDAARCAVDVQRSMAARCRGPASDRRVIFRIGLSCGRVMADQEDIYGHDVNVAARLQTVAPPGGIAMSSEVAGFVRNTLALALTDMGMQRFHNMDVPVHVFYCGFSD